MKYKAIDKNGYLLKVSDIVRLPDGRHGELIKIISNRRVLVLLEDNTEILFKSKLLFATKWNYYVKNRFEVRTYKDILKMNYYFKNINHKDDAVSAKMQLYHKQLKDLVLDFQEELLNFQIKYE